jgi:hypothetical protein
MFWVWIGHRLKFFPLYCSVLLKSSYQSSPVRSNIRSWEWLIFALFRTKWQIFSGQVCHWIYPGPGSGFIFGHKIAAHGDIGKHRVVDSEQLIWNEISVNCINCWPLANILTRPEKNDEMDLRLLIDIFWRSCCCCQEV